MQGGARLDIQCFQLLLVKVADMAVFTGGSITGQERQFTDQAFQECRFARAVFAQQAVAAAGAQLQIDPGQDRVVPVSQGSAIEYQ